MFLAAGKRSSLAPFLRSVFRCERLRPLALRAILRLEGGPMWSVTFREVMRDYCGVEIGIHSYGDSLRTGRLPEGTRIGNYCSLAAGISVFRRNHPTQRFSQHPFFFNSASGLIADDTIRSVRDHPLVVSSDVWIGANAIITPGCRSIGLGAVVAAGAVVTRDVPPFVIVGGNPARRIRDRFMPEIQEVLLESHWWDYPLDRLIPVLPLFLEDATLESAHRLRKHLQSCSLPC